MYHGGRSDLGSSSSARACPRTAGASSRRPFLGPSASARGGGGDRTGASPGDCGVTDPAAVPVPPAKLAALRLFFALERLREVGIGDLCGGTDLAYLAKAASSAEQAHEAILLAERQVAFLQSDIT